MCRAFDSRPAHWPSRAETPEKYARFAFRPACRTLARSGPEWLPPPEQNAPRIVGDIVGLNAKDCTGAVAAEESAGQLAVHRAPRRVGALVPGGAAIRLRQAHSAGRGRGPM